MLERQKAKIKLKNPKRQSWYNLVEALKHCKNNWLKYPKKQRLRI